MDPILWWWSSLVNASFPAAVILWRAPSPPSRRAQEIILCAPRGATEGDEEGLKTSRSKPACLGHQCAVLLAAIPLDARIDHLSGIETQITCPLAAAVG